jgi:prepilin-type processing-associated H-X9-DG protein
LQYVQDYDESWPCGQYYATYQFNTGVAWVGQVYPYIKNSATFMCPDERALPGANQFMVSYAYNEAIPWGLDTFVSTTIWGGANCQNSKFSMPVSTVLLAEIKNVSVTKAEIGSTGSGSVYSPALIGTGTWGFTSSTLTAGGNLVCGAITYPIAGSCTINTCPPRHTDGANWLMADGHVKLLRSELISAGAGAVTPTAAPGASYGTVYRAAGTSYPGYAATFSPI